MTTHNIRWPSGGGKAAKLVGCRYSSVVIVGARSLCAEVLLSCIITCMDSQR